jgi:hypothetical protein
MNKQTWPDELNLPTTERRAAIAAKGQRFLEKLAEEVKLIKL